MKRQYLGNVELSKYIYAHTVCVYIYIYTEIGICILPYSSVVEGKF